MAWFQHVKLYIASCINLFTKIQKPYLSMAMDSKECSLLPFELFEEILCRVPTKSLLRLKLTCKRWLALFNDKRFIYKHLALVREHIIRTNQMVKIINPVVGACSSFSLPNKFQVKGEIYTMVPCDGLLLCIFETGSMAVWNPCLNQVRWIFLLNPSFRGCSCYGIGYDGLSRDSYKILRFVNGVFTKNEYANTGSYKPEVDIYELKSNSWKTFKVSLDWHVVLRCKGLSLKGNMYWIAKWNRKPDIFIQSFNFSTETFEPLCSLPVRYDVHNVVALSAFKGDNLSLLHQSKETSKIDVWVTNKVKNGVSILWTKLFSVTRPDLPVLLAFENLSYPVHFIDKNNRIVVCCEEVLADKRNVAVNIYVIGEDEIKSQDEIEQHQLGFSWPFISGYTYLPSLVPVPSSEDNTPE
ncbi:F-box and associated interaction domains-containing protein [Arabidopsis thaliana]|uniref:F-box/WD-40 repeat-containing protein 1 n=1 Tax=Arabidopsis thaliana TaxID=3702 RepID=FBW1_ARATH|nr:F-box and associated interaction domains-containing protein [Arabidopsis thaliana]Q4PSN6.1 RecName: Full=F-box/WD-40 repeat-containing protein 1; AltName: Full=WD-40-associated F-box protein 1 [Arabidopsis thaliana]AAY78748.1 F-box family protein [Arabidopsis thaliana]AEE76506.1 F-box and associated interaction domains-containing protein [Arabidopsis thaliana]|eukprot:NP_566684.1 F-box and associated interaction domains-containing protein [Arabidopsis thaliana]